MPIPPRRTPFISDLRGVGLPIPPDAIVVRGYLGPPAGVLEQDGLEGEGALLANDRGGDLAAHRYSKRVQATIVALSLVADGST